VNTGNERAVNQERLKDDLTQFTLSLIQALLKTGYYAPEHPSSLKAKSGLYEDFVKLLGNKDEITFVKFVQPEKLDVLIEGVLDEQFSLKSGMSGGMAELFIPRFIDYFVRRNLASFSIKKIIEKAAFENFLELMSKPHTEHDNRKDAFIEELKLNGIFNVSVIFDVDLLGEIKALPWRVRLTLARFVKDIRLLPVFKDKSQLIQAKTELIKEIVMPLKEPALLKDILFNCDLAEKLMADAAEIDVPGTIISVIPVQHLIKICEIMMREYSELKKSLTEKLDETTERKKKRYFTVISRVTFKLIEDNDTTGDAILEEIHTNQMVAYEALPVRIKKAIKIKEFAKILMQTSDVYLARILENKPVEETNTTADMIMFAIPEVLKHENYELVSKIIKSYQRYKESSEIVKHAIGLLETDHILKQLEPLFPSANIHTADAIMDVFRLSGKAGVPYLISILKKAENIGIRKKIINILSALGLDSEPVLLKELIKKDQPWYLLRNIILVLGDIKSKKAPNLFSELWLHEHPRVREEILASTYKIFDKDGEGIFIEALEDRNDAVRKKAIYYLGMIKSTDKNVIKELINIIRKRSADEKEPSDSLQAQAVVSLGLIGSHSKDYYDAIEQTLIYIMTPEQKKLLGIGKSGMREKSDIVKITMCNAIAMLGSKKAVPLLDKLQRSKNNELAKAAVDAISKIAAAAAQQ
jgi:HEAT repeat protein